MDILMNGQIIDIELEKEKTLKDLGESITSWAAERDLIFTGLSTNDDFYLADELPESDLSGFESIDLQIQSRADLIIASLSEGSAYCERVIEYITRSKEEGSFELEELESFYAGVEWLTDVTRSVFGQLDIDLKSMKYMDKSVEEHIDSVNDMTAELEIMAKESAAAAVLEFLDEQRSIFELFKGLFKLALLSDNIKSMVIKSIDSPDLLVQSLVDSKEQAEGQLVNLEKISEYFQSGKDDEASELLHQFLDFIQVFLRTSIQSAPVFGIDPEEIAVDGVSVEAKNSEISEFLEEVVEAMENEDIVSASDILEYELKPALESIPEYIDLLLEKIGAQS